MHSSRMRTASFSYHLGEGEGVKGGDVVNRGVVKGCWMGYGEGGVYIPYQGACWDTHTPCGQKNMSENITFP